MPDRAGLKVTGEVCLPTYPVWERALEEVPRQRQEGPYWLELSALTFIDVAGATALATTAQSLDDEQRIVLDHPPPALSRLLELFWPELSAIEVATS
ncbi:STAS domain-containing protein [Streptomyces aureocirculatus]|uniref:STAS domain-containing protein n=1 Tax=Streptomyces aureocirculatus TaxID=67275 RepID=UPI001CED9E9E|nr:STAS domain-containing protein [Streptomyces aureocirculatus]